MKNIALLLLLSLVSCASKKPRFVKEKVCSQEALKYLRNPRNQFKTTNTRPSLIAEIGATTTQMQQCYEEFKDRTGHEEFNTCLVVGVDYSGNVDFFNFSSEEVQVDQGLINCAQKVTSSIPYSQYGKNFILIQSYQFYVSSKF